MSRFLLSFLFLCYTLSAAEESGQEEAKSIYASPGVVVNSLGGDHLYNLPSLQGLFVEFVGPENLKEPTLMKLQEVFKKKHPNIPSYQMEKIAHPFFHLLVFVQKIPGGYATFMQGRLFEKVHLKRVRFDTGVSFQAVTWERADFFIAPENAFDAEITESVEMILKDFTDR